MSNIPEPKAAADARIRKQDENQDKLAASGAPFLAGILAVNAVQDTMLVRHLDDKVSTNIVHPYLGITAWHRVGPEPGMSLLMQSRLESTEAEGFVYYVTKSKTDKPQNNIRATNYEAGTDVYRPIQQGEQELNSKGVAQIYMSRRPVLEVRGGAIRSWWDQDKLEFGTKAVTHRMVMHKNVSNAVGDELRLGVVSRPGKAQGGSTGNSYINSAYVKLNGSFAKEFLYVINGGTSTPAVLVDHREGNVIGDDGKEITAHTNAGGGKLRYRKILFNTNGQKTELQVNTDGNVYCTLPDDAKNGMVLNVPQGVFKAKIEKDITWKGNTNFDADVQKNMTLRAQKTTKLIGQEVRLGTDNANEPVLLGTTYQNAESQLVTTVGTQETSAAAAYNAALGTLESFSAALTAANALPFVPGAIFSNVVNGIIQVMNSCFTAQSQASTQKATAYSTFKSSYSTYLSSIVKTA